MGEISLSMSMEIRVRVDATRRGLESRRASILRMVSILSPQEFNRDLAGGMNANEPLFIYLKTLALL